MVRRYIIISVCFALIGSVSSLETVNGKIKLTMGVASGCSNAMNFIRNQLEPTYAIFYEYMDVEFVSWGRTVKNPDGSMTCQFGPNDCWANRLQRCVQNFLKNDTMAKMRYMVCEFTAPFPSFAGQSFDCARAAGISNQDLEFCVNNPQLDTLDEEAQSKAAEPMRVINWVPFVLFNDVIDVQAHSAAHVNLYSMICQALINDISIPIRNC